MAPSDAQKRVASLVLSGSGWGAFVRASKASGHVMKRIRAFLALVALLSGSTSEAHQDRYIELKSDGTLVGLPAEYGPAALRLTFQEKEHEPSVSGLTLELGQTKTVLPECVTALLQTPSSDGVAVYASWYHDERTLPYYLYVRFFDAEAARKVWTSPGFSLLFNLHNGKLLKMEVHIPRYGGKGAQVLPIDLRSLCSHEALQSISDVIASP